MSHIFFIFFDMLEKDVKNWVEFGKQISKFEDKLNTLTDQENSEHFRRLYYNITKPSFNITKAEIELIKPLAKVEDRFSIGSNERTALKEFISITRMACNNDKELAEFRSILIRNNWTPIDEEERQQQQDDERRGQELNKLKEKDVKNWVDFGKQILRFEDKLNTLTDQENSERFRRLYYNITKPSFNITNAERNLIKPLSKVEDRFPIGSDERKALKEFISLTRMACSNEKELAEFRNILIKNNWTPVDEDEIKRKQELERRRQQQQQDDERRRQEFERYRRQQQDERRRQEQQQQEAERKRQQQEDELRRRLQQETERRRKQQEKEDRIKRIGKTVLIVIGIIVLAIFNNYRSDKKEYRKLVAESEKYVKQQQYQKATESLKKIKKITNNKKMVADANSRLDKINYEKEKTSKKLRKDINTVWEAYFIKNTNGTISNTLDKNIMKYINKNEIIPIIESMSQKTKLLQNATEDQGEYNDNITKINNLKKYYNIQ